MIRYIALFVLLASGCLANETPTVPAGGLSFFSQQPCADQETGEEGYCYTGKTTDGRVFLTFWQGDILMFIREIVGDGYTLYWMNDKYNSI